MRFTISPEQQKFFQTQHYLELENLLTVEDAAALMSAIDGVRDSTPGYPEENLFRSLPIITTLVKRKGWAILIGELLHKTTLRIEYDKFFATSPSLEPFDEDSCALLIELNTKRGFFFKDVLSIKIPLDSPPYFLIILTARHLPEHLNPTILK